MSVIRRVINGVEYWWDEETRKVHSPVSAGLYIEPVAAPEPVAADPVSEPAPEPTPTPAA